MALNGFFYDNIASLKKWMHLIAIFLVPIRSLQKSLVHLT